MNDRDRGVYNKFTVTRNDGSSEPGGKHEGCEYFVLDLTHDPFAMPALRAYAANCAKKYPQLAADLREKLPDVDAGWWGSYECFGCSLVFDVQTTYDPDDVVNCPKCKGTCDLRGRWLADVGSFGGRSEFIVLPQPSTPGAVSDEWSPTIDDMPEGICVAKRIHVERERHMDNWFVGFGKDESCQIEGTANHWYWLAYALLGLVDEKDSPYSEDKPLPFSPAYIRAALESFAKRSATPKEDRHAQD